MSEDVRTIPLNIADYVAAILLHCNNFSKITGWQVLPVDAPDFESAALRACELVLAGGLRIGKIPGARKSKSGTRSPKQVKTPKKHRSTVDFDTARKVGLRKLNNANDAKSRCSDSHRSEEDMPDQTYKQRLEQYGNKLTTQQKLYFQPEYDKQSRNPSTALILALLLGGAGAHRFYLGQWGLGVAYLLFAWTFICVECVRCMPNAFRSSSKKHV